MIQAYMENRQGFFAIVGILLAVACAAKQPCVGKVCIVDDEPTSLLQTFHQVNTRSQPDSEKALRHGSNGDTEGKSLLGDAGTVSALDKAATEEKCVTWMPMDMRILHHGLTAVGLSPPEGTCNPGDPMFGLMDFMLTELTATTHRLGVFEFEDSYFLILPGMYGTIMIFLLGRMLVNILHPNKLKQKQQVAKGLRRPEAESWERGYMNWLFVDWIDDWITKWGNVENSDTTKISSEDLDDTGDPEDEVENSYKKLKMIWEDEVDSVGVQNANIALVICRFVGWTRLMGIALWSMFYETCMFLGPPLAMAWVIRYVEWLYMARLQGEVITWKALTPAACMIITLFQGLPAFIAISNSVSTMLGMRMSMRICGGLSSLVFKKAQRLPLCSLDDEQATKNLGPNGWEGMQNVQGSTQEPEQSLRDDPDDDTAAQSMMVPPVAVKNKDAKEQKEDEQFCARWGHHFPHDQPECCRCSAPRPKDQKAEDSAELVYDEEGSTKTPTKFNLVQVVANDINTNIIDAPLAICRLVVLCPIGLILFNMLWGKIHLAVVACMCASTVLAFFIFWAAGSNMGWMAAFMFYCGKRLMFVEDMLFNIRTVKAFGWEGIMEERIKNLRTMELAVLDGYYLRLGFFYGILYQFPKVMVLFGLWGYTWIYGNDKPVNIFTTLPILFTFQAAIMSILTAVPTALNAVPSLHRVGQFLKLPEAPFPRSEDAQTPAWVNIWPEGPEVDDAGVPRVAQIDAAPVTLQIQGSFQWKGVAAPTMKDLNLSIPVGSSVAILGKVGSGKTSLLHAMIGEMAPVGDARISIPSQIAYSGQTPYICEGTLKENVLFGEPYNEKRYHACIYAASLIPDIQVLPGGDEVPIGSRGISLSGGQRARVSMARAAYCSSAECVLIDDPFAAVDSRTALHLLNEYVHGAALKGRTKVIACQPDPERIMDFDKVIILHGGRIVVEGTPKEVMQTKPYTNLLNEHQKGSLDQAIDSKAPQVAGSVGLETLKSRTEAFSLREDEFENRPDWKTMKHFLDMGGWWYLSACIGLFLFMMIVQLMMNIVLQNWASDDILLQAGMLDPPPTPTMYLRPYLIWWAIFCVLWTVCWACGMRFTLNLSQKAHMETMSTILHAPVDRFFDRTPVGRIMNRISTDLLNIDIGTFNNITSMISIVWMNGVPLVYLHLLMPIYFSCACIPFYYLVFLLVRRFWNTMVPMRYLTHISKSYTDTNLTEVDNSNAFVRACRKGDYKFQQFQSDLMNQLMAEVTTSTFLKRWLVNRLFLMMGFFVCSMVLICVYVPNTIAIGGVGLCLANMFQMIASIETDIATTMSAQFQFISMKRLQDYTSLDQEAAFEKETDAPYANYCITVERAKLGALARQNTENGLVITRRQGSSDVTILAQAENNMLMAAKGFAALEPSEPELGKCQEWHRLVAVNGKRGFFSKTPRAFGEIDALVDELCNGTSDEVALQIQSGWMLPGAHLVIKNLVAGYGDIAQNVLKEVSIDVLPRTKVGVVGTTGCGKSTLLLCILRILEPKGGKIILNGVDTAELGLKTLRTTIGMVAQDPVLMQSSVRDNLDPFGQFDDDIIWKGLDMVQMKDHIAALPNGLGFEIQADGNNLSYGQRQLLCLARTVIRQPALILLDEATSALDPATQQQVQHTVEDHFPDSTMIMIAHRLETIVNFDKVVVMDKGKIAEQGMPGELQKVKDGIFAKMWAAKQTW